MKTVRPWTALVSAALVMKAAACASGGAASTSPPPALDAVSEPSLDSDSGGSTRDSDAAETHVPPLVPRDEACKGDVTFQAPALEKKIREQLGQPEGPLSGDSLLEVLSLIDVAGVTSLAGVECLKNLEKLGMYAGRIDSLEPVRQLTRLKVIRFQGFGVRSLSPLNDKPHLKEVSADDNSIETLDDLNLRDLVGTPDEGRCFILGLSGNPLAKGDADVGRFCDLGWTVVWRSEKACGPSHCLRL